MRLPCCVGFHTEACSKSGLPLDVRTAASPVPLLRNGSWLCLRKMGCVIRDCGPEPKGVVVAADVVVAVVPAASLSLLRAVGPGPARRVLGSVLLRWEGRYGSPIPYCWACRLMGTKEDLGHSHCWFKSLPAHLLLVTPGVITATVSWATQQVLGRYWSKLGQSFQGDLGEATGSPVRSAFRMHAAKLQSLREAEPREKKQVIN